MSKVKQKREAKSARGKKLIEDNALGDDRNLLEHGVDDLHYWYSVGDGFRLVLWLRQKYLDYTHLAIVNTGEEYASFRENNNNILITDPYHSNNFAKYLVDDIARITATNSFAGLIASWTQMPKTIIIPLLSGLHWRAIKVDINYYDKTCNILFGDPYGKIAFPECLKQFTAGVIKSNVEKLIKIQTNDETFVLSDELISVTEKEVDQQGYGENGWDCGPITFSNIEDYIKSIREENHQLIFTIPDHNNPEHKTKIVDTRTQNVVRYGEVAGIAIDKDMLSSIKESLEGERQKRKEKLKTHSLHLDDWPSFFVDKVYVVLENNRLYGIYSGIEENKEYSSEELKYAYGVVLEELTRNSNTRLEIGISSNKKENINSEQEGEVRENKLKDDLSKFIEVESLINNIVNVAVDSSVVLRNLGQIGQLISDISWDEDNTNCIRNKHGYRDRSKKGGNEKNDQGAKIDFEALAHLKDLAKDLDIQWTLTVNKDLLRGSLANLQQKVQLVLLEKYSHLNEAQLLKIAHFKDLSIKGNHDEDTGFIRQVSSYYHDMRCISELERLLSAFKNKENISLDLSNKVNTYHVGYLFCRIGEVAKEISDFIKPETHRNAENNVTRFFFGKLGHYR